MGLPQNPVHKLEAGIPLPVIKNFLGHSSIEVTMIYATVSDELKNKYLKENSLASALLGNSKKNENKHTYPELKFLNKCSAIPFPLPGGFGTCTR